MVGAVVPTVVMVVTVGPKVVTVVFVVPVVPSEGSNKPSATSCSTGMQAVMLVINSATTLEISPAVGSVITFSACFAVELAMLFQTIKNREANSCRQNFGYKLIFVTLLMISSLVTLLIGIF